MTTKTNETNWDKDMNCNHLLLCLFGILACFFTVIAAHEAIVGGRLAPYRDFEYHVTILIAHNPPQCGGGIIKEQYVVTAAHCVIRPDHREIELLSRNISILAGTVDLKVPGVVVKVQRVYVPVDYTSEKNCINGDIAALKLKEPLEMEKYNLQLLHIAGNISPSYYDKGARIAGLGWDTIYENNELIGDNSDHKLRFAETTILNNSECQLNHPTLRISKKHLCARVMKWGIADYRRGVCIGDAGGPLVYKSNTVIAVLSRTTIGCSETNSSGIYVRIANYRHFLYCAMTETSNRAMRIRDV